VVSVARRDPDATLTKSESVKKPFVEKNDTTTEADPCSVEFVRRLCGP
jgi:hypothetical protein